MLVLSCGSPVRCSAFSESYVPCPFKAGHYFGGFCFVLFFAFFKVHGFSSFWAKRIQIKLDKVEARLSSTCQGGRLPSDSPG